jgi:MoxR-like ATPase
MNCRYSQGNSRCIQQVSIEQEITYPTKEEEKKILERMARSSTKIDVQPVISPKDILRLRELADEIYMDEKVEDYILNIVQATRTPEKYGLDVGKLIQYGASPRATIYLAMASRAHALMQGRGYVTPQDVKSIGMDVLRHRVIVTYEAEAEEKTPENVVGAIFDSIAVP